jgi:PknH-like extracellular domain
VTAASTNESASGGRAAWGGPRRRSAVAAGLRGVTLAAIGLCLLLTGCSVTTGGRPTAAPDLGRWQPPTIQPAQLDGLLLSPSEVNDIGGSTNLTLRSTLSQMATDDENLIGRSCLDIYSPIQQSVYRDSNWNVVTGQLLNDAGAQGSPRHALIQALVGFPDVESARQFFRQAEQRWSACSGRSAFLVRPGRPMVAWSFRDVETNENTLTATQIPNFSDGYTCQRAMGLRKNVIIDTLWCGFGTTNQAAQVVGKIAAAASHT